MKTGVEVKESESEKEQEPKREGENIDAIKEDWRKLWPGESMEVNVEAKHGFID